jgi:hypothetical protein
MKYSLDKYKFYFATKADGTPYQVVAVSTYAGRKVKGVAKCDPRDEFSIENGRKLAAARCNLKVAEKRAKRAEKKYADAVKMAEDQIRFRNRMESYRDDSAIELKHAQIDLDNLLSNM